MNHATNDGHNRPAGRGVVVAAALSVLLAGGCTVGPDYERPGVTTPETWQQTARETDPALLPDPASLERWWTVFGDPVLDRLIEEAGRSNHDVRIAMARVEEARAYLGVVSGELSPQVGASADAQRYRVSESTLPLPGGQTRNAFSLGVGATWEIDVFGRIRRAMEAARAEYEATEEDRNDVLIAVYAEVARNYINLRTAQNRLQASLHNIESQREIVELTRTRFKYGLASDLDVAQAEQVLAASEAVVPLLRVQVDAAMNALAVLVGREPGALDAELAEVRPIPEVPENVAVGVPADLIRRRPDIRRAERLLAAQTARIGMATAELYPRFDILGFFGLASGNTSALFTSGSHTYTLGGGVTWNLFAGGAIRSQIRVEDAKARQALLRYERTVLEALRQVEDSLVAVTEFSRRRAALARNAEAAERSLRHALELYKDGLRDFQSTLDAERALFDAVNQMADADGGAVLALVNLYQSLGGGWNPDAPEASFASARDKRPASRTTNEVR